MPELTCPCGAIIEGQTDDELVEKAQAHLARDHPHLAGVYTREQILSRAHAE
jgi:hypothetical protein